jgi:hypothetical protein
LGAGFEEEAAESEGLAVAFDEEEVEALGTLGGFGTLGAEVDPSRSFEALARGTGRCCFEGAG